MLLSCQGGQWALERQRKIKCAAKTLAPASDCRCFAKRWLFVFYFMAADCRSHRFLGRGITACTYLGGGGLEALDAQTRTNCDKRKKLDSIPEATL